MTDTGKTTPLTNASALDLIRYIEAMEQACAGIRRVLADVAEEDAAPEQTYAITVNGKSRGVTDEEVEAFRQIWSGHFLLDLPRMVLRMQTEEKDDEEPLGRGDRHQGVVRLLSTGMRKPDSCLGPETLPAAQTRLRKNLGANVVRRYVRTARRIMGETGRPWKYLLTVPVDRDVSRSGWGYMFNSQFEYVVIEARSPRVRRRIRDDGNNGNTQHHTGVRG